MSTSLLLPPDELAAITGYKMPRRQAQWLKQHKWRFVLNRAGRPVVATEYAMQQLGVAGSGHAAEVGPQPNFGAIGAAR